MMTCDSCGAATDPYGRHLPPPQPDGFTVPSLAVDALVLRKGDDSPELLLIRRGQEPDCGQLALPGGFVEYGENPDDSVLRELAEETGLTGRNPHPLTIAGHPQRDPRKHVVSIVYLVEVSIDDVAVAGDDAAEVVWSRISALPTIHDNAWAFDHGHIVHDVLQHPWVIKQGIVNE